jgi:hypothetical protein
MHELDNYRYPYRAGFYPPLCICLGLTVMLGGISFSIAYQTIDHFTLIFVYSFVFLVVGICSHLERYAYTDEE